MVKPVRNPLVGLLALALVGCGDRPRAPVVSREAVFSDDAIGLRFATPDGWMAVSRATLPPGPLAKPVIVASYMLPRGDRPTELELVAADPVAEGDLERFLTDTPIGPDRWRAKDKPTPAAVNGVSAERLTLARVAREGEVLREVTAFRRPTRTYLFVITYLGTDRDARDAAHKCVESAEWK